MASGQQITVKLMRGDSTSWGFRLQGGKDFAIPLSVVKVNPGSLADQAGLKVADIIIRIGDHDAEQLRHKEAQEAIISAGNYLTMVVQRGEMSTWRPCVTPVGDLRPGQNTYTQTSLKKAPPQQPSKLIGSGHNVNAKPFPSGNVPALVHKQYNSPVNLYSEKSIAETLEAHTEVLTSGAKGINFMRPDAPINKESAVYQMVHDEEQRKAKGESASTSVSPDVSSHRSGETYAVTRHVEAPADRPASERPEKANQNICAECERLIVGVFVRVKDRSLHAECFRCATCGTSLKNVGYFTINDKLYCDIHAKQVASLINTNGSILPVPPPNGVSSSMSPNPPSISLTTPTPPTPSNIGSVPYQSTQSVHQFNSSSSLQFSTPKKYSPVPPPVAPKPAFRATPSATPNPTPLYGNSVSNQTDGYPDGYRPFTGRPKPIWSPAQTYDPTGVTQLRDNYNREPVRRERPASLYSSFPMSISSNITSSDFKRTSSFASFPSGSPSVATYATSFAQHSTVQTKVPPMTAPKPQINPQSWTTGSSYSSSAIPGPGQSSIPGSRPAPRRGRGLLKTPMTGSTIPICGSCGSPIRGPFIIALNKTWCPHHFICGNSQCNRSLEEIGFVEEQGKLYCENCYESYMAPICSKCSQRIKGDCLNALERQWHPECFSCAYCKRPFGNSSFYMEDGLPYCEKDWNELFTTKCVGCGFAIEAGDRWVEALNQNYHSNCFMCTVCHKNLEGQSFYAKNGRPFCKSHAR